MVLGQLMTDKKSMHASVSGLPADEKQLLTEQLVGWLTQEIEHFSDKIASKID